MTKEIRNRLERIKGQRDQISQDLKTLKEELTSSKHSLIKHEKALEIIRIVSLETQKQLQFRISEITSLALDAVFSNPYELVVEFVQRRNKTECDIYFVRDGNKVDPLNAAGVGAIDVATFALRVAVYSMIEPHSRNILILDEPFKHLKGEEENHRVLNMINEISRRMNLQILMVSDERISKEDIIEAADRVFEVKKRKGVSKVVQL